MNYGCYLSKVEFTLPFWHSTAHHLRRISLLKNVDWKHESQWGRHISRSPPYPPAKNPIGTKRDRNFTENGKIKLLAFHH